MPAAPIGALAATGGAPAGSIAPNMPTSIAAGELLVAVVIAYDDATLAGTPSAGWSAGAVSTATTGSITKVFTYYKTAAGGDTLTVTWSAGSPYANAGVQRFDGHGGYDTSAEASASSSTTIDGAAITLSAAGLSIVGLGDFNNLLGSTTLTGYTSLGSWDANSGRMFYKAGLSAGTEDPGVMTASGSDFMGAVTIGILDAGGGGGVDLDFPLIVPRHRLGYNPLYRM